MNTAVKSAGHMRSVCGVTPVMRNGGRRREGRGGGGRMCAQKTAAAEAEAVADEKEEMDALRGVVRPPPAQSVGSSSRAGSG